MRVEVTIALCVATGTLASASRNGLGRTPLMGWSTWCTSASCYQAAGIVPKNNSGLHDFCDEELVLSSAHALVDGGLAAVGYNHVLLDGARAWGYAHCQSASSMCCCVHVLRAVARVTRLRRRSTSHASHRLLGRDDSGRKRLPVGRSKPISARHGLASVTGARTRTQGRRQDRVHRRP